MGVPGTLTIVNVTMGMMSLTMEMNALKRMMMTTTTIRQDPAVTFALSIHTQKM
jgi:hypothetical protein